MTPSDGGKGSDRRPTDEQAFASNYEAIFGKSRAKRGSYVQDESGKLVPKEEYYGPSETNAPFVMADIQPYKNMVDGKMITSRSHHREFLKANRLVEVGNELKAHTTKQKPKVDREQIRRDIHTSMLKLGM